MWRHWIDDTPSTLDWIQKAGTESPKFDYKRLLERVVKDEDEMAALLRQLRENLGKILIYQKMLLAINDKQYPQIPFDPCLSCIMNVQDNNQNQRTRFQKAHIELCFQAATNEDGVAGLRGAMHRSELLNYIIRLVVQFARLQQQLTQVNDSFSDCFAYVVHLFIDPICDDNPITS